MKKPHWHTLPYNSKLKENAKTLRKAGNLAEVLLWQKIKGKQIAYDFDRQKIIGNYIVDFYCKQLGLVIEIDGSSHNDKYEYDQTRKQYLESFGLKVICVLDVDIKNNLAGVIECLKGLFAKREDEI